MSAKPSARTALAVAWFILASSLVVADAAAQSNQIRIETVGNYSSQCGGSSACNTYSNIEGDGFRNAMTAAGTGWALGAHYKDNSVWDLDFHDPDLTRVSGDNDTYFDRLGRLTSMCAGSPSSCRTSVPMPGVHHRRA